MNSHLLKLAGDIIRQVNRQHPADVVLRNTLKSQRGLSPADSTSVTRAVFAYFRWLNWLEPGTSLRAQLARALELTREFSHAPERFRDEDLLQRAVPDWIRREMDLPEAWVRSLQREPVLWLRARAGQGPSLAASLGNCEIFGEAEWTDSLKYVGEADLFRTPEFHDGQFEIQDLSSQAVGFLCRPAPGETWWDACAGEGGKLLHLSDLMKNQGLIWASDRAAWRLQGLKRRAARARVFNYRAALWTGGQALPTKTRFDGVLLDAPCSGVGTWHRNPHARWTTSPGDISQLSRVQTQLLAHAAAAVKPGGGLFYAVCTLTRAETVEVADSFQQSFPEFQPLDLSSPLVKPGCPSARLTLWPQDFGGNGMFVAAWSRRSAGK